MTNDDHGVVIGYSPDGLVGDDGLIECKSRRQKYQIETILADKCLPSTCCSARLDCSSPGGNGWISSAIAAGCPCSSSASGRARKFIIAIHGRGIGIRACAWRLIRPDNNDEWRNLQPVVIHTERTIGEQEIMI